jgi:hypothetical protein
VVAVDGRVLADRRILEHDRLLFAGEQLDIVAQPALVPLQCEDERGPLSPEDGAIAIARIGDVFELGWPFVLGRCAAARP